MSSMPSKLISSPIGEQAKYVFAEQQSSPQVSKNIETKLNKTILEKEDALGVRELIIRVYKQMRLYLRKEDVFRNPAETVREFKLRVQQLLNLSDRGVGRLSTIFEWVDYSSDKPKKEDGIEALNSLDVVEGEIRKK